MVIASVFRDYPLLGVAAEALHFAGHYAGKTLLYGTQAVARYIDRTCDNCFASMEETESGKEQWLTWRAEIGEWLQPLIDKIISCLDRLQEWLSPQVERLQRMYHDYNTPAVKPDDTPGAPDKDRSSPPPTVLARPDGFQDPAGAPPAVFTLTAPADPEAPAESSDGPNLFMLGSQYGVAEPVPHAEPVPNIETI